MERIIEYEVIVDYYNVTWTDFEYNILFNTDSKREAKIFFYKAILNEEIISEKNFVNSGPVKIHINKDYYDVDENGKKSIYNVEIEKLVEMFSLNDYEKAKEKALNGLEDYE